MSKLPAVYEIDSLKEVCHTLHRIQIDKNADGSIFSVIPSCSCGWRGEEYNMDMFDQVPIVEMHHLGEAMFSLGFKYATEYVKNAGASDLLELLGCDKDIRFITGCGSDEYNGAFQKGVAVAYKILDDKSNL